MRKSEIGHDCNAASRSHLPQQQSTWTSRGGVHGETDGAKRFEKSTNRRY